MMISPVSHSTPPRFGSLDTTSWNDSRTPELKTYKQAMTELHRILKISSDSHLAPRSTRQIFNGLLTAARAFQGPKSEEEKGLWITTLTIIKQKKLTDLCISPKDLGRT